VPAAGTLKQLPQIKTGTRFLSHKNTGEAIELAKFAFNDSGLLLAVDSPNTFALDKKIKGD
jgi:hypothetical protein